MGRKIGVDIVILWMVLAVAGMAREGTTEKGKLGGSGAREAGVGLGQGEKVFLRPDPGGYLATIRDIFFLDNGQKLLSA